MKPKLLPRSFRLSTILLLLTFVGIILWFLTPSRADLIAESKLIGNWEVRLTETLDATTETRVVEYLESELVGTARRVYNRYLAPTVQKHYWCVRNGRLISGMQHTTPRESAYKTVWSDDDTLTLEFIGLDGRRTRVYNRCVKSGNANGMQGLAV